MCVLYGYKMSGQTVLVHRYEQRSTAVFNTAMLIHSTIICICAYERIFDKNAYATLDHNRLFHSQQSHSKIVYYIPSTY